MIKRIRIQGFKSIRDQTVDLEPVTVLVGRSGTGKSAFVQAIRFLRNLLLLGPGEDLLNIEGGAEAIMPAGVPDPCTSFEVTFELPGDGEYTYEIGLTWAARPGQPRWIPRIVRERFSHSGEVIFGRFVQKMAPADTWKWEAEPKLVPTPRVDTVAPLLGALPGLPRVGPAYTVLATAIGFYHFSSTVLGAGEPRAATGDENLPGLRSNASNYLAVYKAIIQNFRDRQAQQFLLGSLRVLNESVVSVDLDSLKSETKLVVGHQFGDRVLPLELQQESDGFRRFFAHLLALYQAPPKFLNIFEEPENAIYPGALSLLADEFRHASESDRGHVIVTTHSPGLLDHFDVSSIRVVEMHNGETVIGPVSASQRQAVEERLLSTGELLTVSRAAIDDPQPEALAK